jgi:chromate transporter
VILRAVHRIGEHILLDRWLWATGAAAAAASFAGVSFWIVLPAAGAAYALASSRRYVLAGLVIVAAALVAFPFLTRSASVSDLVPASAEAAPTAAMLFWAGLKGGLLTFGGAYTAIPFIRGDTVGRGWMSDGQFLDGMALSGVLPAPLVIFSTFVGWVCGGPAGALAITAGMFLPAFAFSLVFYERLEAVAEHERLHRFLAGVAAGVVGLIAITLVDLARTGAERSPSLAASGAIFAAALLILYCWRSKLATPLVLAAGAAVGMLLIGGSWT